MQRVFIYEFIAGGGLCTTPADQIPSSLLAEGRAMLSAVAEDFALLPGVQVVVMQDRRLEMELPAGVEVRCVDSDEQGAFASLAAQADHTLVIAPEFDRILQDRAQLVLFSGGHLLGPSPEVIALCSDKHRTAEHLLAREVRAPRGVALHANDPLPHSLRLPVVVKPRFGAGSQHVYLVQDAAEWADLQVQLASLTTDFRVEEHCGGLAVSAAVVSGPCGMTSLPVCAQHLSDDGRFCYCGGSLPLDPANAARATALSRRAVDLLPQPHGYLGIDMVLGSNDDGSEDYVIEINPRLTTSYVGLRAAARTNLAQLMLDVVNGNEVEAEFDYRPRMFKADGHVVVAQESNAL